MSFSIGPLRTAMMTRPASHSVDRSHGAFPFSMLLVPFRVGFTQQIPLCSGSDRVLRTHCLHRNVMACGHLRRFKYRRPQESFDQHYAAVFTILAGHRSCFRVFSRCMKVTSGSRCETARCLQGNSAGCLPGTFLFVLRLLGLTATPMVHWSCIGS